MKATVGKQYLFTREDFIRVKGDPRFIEGLRWLISQNFFPQKEFFRGSNELLNEFLATPREQLSDKILQGKHSFPLLSPIQDPEVTMCQSRISLAGKDSSYLGEDVETYLERSQKCLEKAVANQQDLLRRAIDDTYPEWYCYTHICQDVAGFLIYPMLKILYPEKKLYLFHGLFHTVIINSPLENYSHDPKDYSLRSFSRNLDEPLFFDLIGQCLTNQTLEWLFPTGLTDSYLRMIEEKDIGDWYCFNFSYEGMDTESIKKFFEQFC